MIKLFAAYIITVVLREANELSFYDIGLVPEAVENIIIFLFHSKAFDRN